MRPGGVTAAPRKRGCLSTLFWLSTVGTLAAFCCCFGGLLVLGAVADENSPTPLSRVTDPLVTGTEQAIADVLVPETTEPARAHHYHWPFEWRRYTFGYGTSTDFEASVVARHRRLASSMAYQAEAGDSFRWAPPAGCEAQPWACVYRAVTRSNHEALEEVSRAFTTYGQANGLDERSVVELVISWVQHIDYRMPTDEAFGILPPTLVASRGWGDCDSKALLAALVLDDLGVDTVVLNSTAFKHAALGVDLPGPGHRFHANGHDYLFVEVTAPGWAIGTIPPQVNTPRLWEPIGWK